MKIEVKDSYTLLGDDRDSVKSFAEYLEYIIPLKFEKQHLVIDILKYEDLDLTKLLYFLKISTYHRSSMHSFVLVNNAIDVDDIPSEMVVVPTILEAGDIIDMEAIERDLGF